MKKFMRKLHRWLGLLMAVQIIAWMASGLYFAWYPIETIRGEHLVTEPDGLYPVDFNDLVPVWVAWNNLEIELGGEVKLESTSFVSRDGKTWYRMEGTHDGEGFVRLVNGFTGQLARQISAEDAVRLAKGALREPGDDPGVEWVSEPETGSEYRGRRLPLWRVNFQQPEKLSIYLDPWTGEVVTVRTRRWRIFDFMWMLHIMDFGDRDDFNTPLLQVAAALGLLIALSGVTYWAMTTRAFRRRRSQIKPINT